MAAPRLSTISLYTGVGGLDFGFEAAGFRTAVAVELDPVACRTIRQNRPAWNVIERDIHDVRSEEILDAAGLQPGEADVLIGGAAVPTLLEVVLLGEWRCVAAR